MKAYIVEIYKNYCIAMSADGQFLKQDVAAGLHEIGDEVIIEEPKILQAKKSRNIYGIISRVAIGFAAVAVITTGAYFGIKYIGTSRSAESVSIAQAAVQESQTSQIQSTGEGGAIESSQQADSEDAGEILKAQPQEETLQAPLLYEASYNIDKFNTDLLVQYPDLRIVYRVNREELESAGPGDELSFNFTAVKNNALFNGNVDAVLNDENLIETRTLTVNFEDFAFGQQKYESLILQDIEKSFRLMIYGYFK